jgi:hypothetical protein
MEQPTPDEIAKLKRILNGAVMQAQTNATQHMFTVNHNFFDRFEEALGAFEEAIDDDDIFPDDGVAAQITREDLDKYAAALLDIVSLGLAELAHALALKEGQPHGTA